MPLTPPETERPSASAKCTQRSLKILHKTPLVAFGVVLYFMYILTVGTKMFPDGTLLQGQSAQKISTCLFVASSFASQLLHFFFSSFSVGVITSPIAESFLSTRQLCHRLTTTLPPHQVYPTLLFSMSLSALLTGILFCAVYVLRGERLFKQLPRSFSNALFLVLGLLGVRYANERLGTITLPVRPPLALALFNSLGALLTILSLAARRRCPLVARYSVLWIALAATATFYLVASYSQASFDTLVANGWFTRDPRIPETFSLPLPALGHTNYRAVLHHSRFVLESALVNLLQFPINFPPTVSQTKVAAKTRQELLVNAAANVATSALGCSSYLLPASTIMLRRAGSTEKIDTALIGAGMLICFLCFRQYFDYLPFLVFDLLLLFLGMTIVLNTATDVVTQAPGTIPMVLAVAGVSVLTQNILVGAVTAAGLNLAIALFRKVRSPRSASDN